MRTPYTHAEHVRRVQAAALERLVIEHQPVCVVKLGIRYCARIVAAWTTPSGIDCWTVDADIPESCRFTVPCRQVFLCSCLDAHLDALDAGTQAKRGQEASASEGVTCL